MTFWQGFFLAVFVLGCVYCLLVYPLCEAAGKDEPKP